MANIKKNAQGYGYKYTDLAAINDYIETLGETYYQEIERIDGDDYIITVRQLVLNKANSQLESLRIRGCRVVQASLSGKVNPAQEQGSGLTYARRYSLLMAYGLATEDDDGESLTVKGDAKKPAQTKWEPSKTKPASAQQKEFISNLLQQQGKVGEDQKSYLVDKYGLDFDTDGSLLMSQADAQMIIDDFKGE